MTDVKVLTAPDVVAVSALYSRLQIPWEWHGAAAKDDMLDSLGTLPDVFGIRPADYAEFVLPMTNNVELKDRQPSGKMIGTGKYEQITKLYFQVAGRQAMLRDCVDRYGWDVQENELIITEDKFALVRMEISVAGTWLADQVLPSGETIKEDRPISGSRWGIGKLKGGDSAWEKAETTARGRALGAWGFGLLPGSGLASFEEMTELEEAPQSSRSGRQPPVDKSPDELRVELLTKLELLRQVKDSAEAPRTVEEARTGFVGYVHKSLGVLLPVDDGQIDFAPLSAGQMQLMVNKVDGWIRDARKAAEVEI